MKNIPLNIRYFYREDGDREKFICATSLPVNKDFIQMLFLFKENEIEVTFNELLDELDGEYLDRVFLIEDIRVDLPTKESLFSISVYLI